MYTVCYWGAGYRSACSRTLRLYSAGCLVNRTYATLCAGDSSLGLSSSSWMPRSICLTVMDGSTPRPR